MWPATYDRRVDVQDLPLRERKKLRTREALVDAALTLFAAKGFEATTLDEVVDAVEVSKRTFFRMFPGKEDVALAPENELWATYLAEIRVRPLTGPLLAVYQDTFFVALHRMGDDWERRFTASRRLTDRTPALLAPSLRHCAELTDQVAEVVAGRLGIDTARRVQVRLLLEFVLAAWRWSVAEWSATGPGGREALAGRLREAFAAIPDSLHLTTGSS